MRRSSSSSSFKCQFHQKPILYICVENHVCNAENNRALCEDCLLSHAPNNTANGLESLEDFLAGEFIYSDMQKTIETLENKL